MASFTALVGPSTGLLSYVLAGLGQEAAPSTQLSASDCNLPREFLQVHTEGERAPGRPWNSADTRKNQASASGSLFIRLSSVPL